LYIELQRHQEREEECRNQSLLDAASGLGLPVIAANGVRYATKRDRELLDLFTSDSPSHSRSTSAGRLLTANSARLCVPAREMAALFRDIPEAIANTRIVSDRLEFTLEQPGL
jgi:error-prone DNA polymerase